MDPDLRSVWFAGQGAAEQGGLGALLTLDQNGGLDEPVRFGLDALTGNCGHAGFDYCQAGSSASANGLAFAPLSARLWAVGVQADASGSNPVLIAGALDPVTRRFTDLFIEESTGTAGTAVAADAAGNVWLVGKADERPTLWKVPSSGSAVRVLTAADPGVAKAVAVGPDGKVWMTGQGASNQLVLWEHVPGGGVAQHVWTNTLGGGGGMGRAILVDDAGVVWVAGNAGTGSRTAAVLLRWSGGAFGPVAASTGTSNDAAMALAKDGLGLLRLSGRASAGGGANDKLALWSYDPAAGGTVIALTNLYRDPGFTGEYHNEGRGLAADNGLLWVAGLHDNGRFGVWQYAVGAGVLAGNLSCSGGFTGQLVHFLLSPTSDFQTTPRIVSLPAPADGATAFAYALSGLPAPATYYMAAVYDLSGSMAAGGYPLPDDPIGVYQNDASGNTTVISELVLSAGGSVAGVDFTAAPDHAPPTARILSPADGSTVSSLSAIAGTALDNVGIAHFRFAAHDLDAGLWWDDQEGVWIATDTAPLYRNTHAAITGAANAPAWRIDPAGGLGGRLANGHHYTVYVQPLDFSGNAQAAPGASFTWAGPTGDVLPAPPQNIQGVALSSTVLEWSWDPVSPAPAGYKIYDSATRALLGQTNVPSFTVGGLAPNRSVAVCVTALNVYGEGPENCGPAVFTWAEIPGEPTAVAVSSDSITWSWASAGNPAGTGYQLSLSVDGFVTVSTPVPMSAGLTEASFASTGLDADTTYYARVQAYNGDGILTDFSAYGSARTLSRLPSAPASVVMDALGISSIAWSWSAAAGADSYNVYSSTAGFGLIASVSETRFTQEGLPVNGPAYVCVSGVNAFGEGEQNCSQAVYTLAEIPGAPVAVAVSSSSVSWAWDPAGNPGITGYQLSVSPDGFVTVSTPVPVSAGLRETHAAVAGLLADATYYARVQAYNWDGVLTDFSPQGSTKTLLAAPGAPADVAAVFDPVERALRLSWGPALGGGAAAFYRVYRSDPADPLLMLLLQAQTTEFGLIDRPSASATYYYEVRGVNADLVEGPPACSGGAAYDAVPPEPVTDLRAAAIDPYTGEVSLAWSAPADDFSGVARYLVRSSPSTIGEESFDSADAVPNAVSPASPGSPESLTVALSTAHALYVAVKAEDRLGNRSSVSNSVLLDFQPPSVAILSPRPGDVVARPAVVTVDMSDDIGIAAAYFLVDGVSVSSAAGSGDPSQGSVSAFSFDARRFADGTRVLQVMAVDAAGNPGVASILVTLRYSPPAAPVITQPTSGFVTKVSTIDAAGSAEPGTAVAVLVNGLDVATATVDGAGMWSIRPLDIPEEGTVELTAVAFESRGFSAPSFPVTGVYAAKAPNPPALVQAAPLSAGRAEVSWSAPAGKTPAFYRVYRSLDDAQLPPGSAAQPSLRSADNVREFRQEDLPPSDDLWFYAVTAVDGAFNESALSESAYAVTDRVAPTVSITLPGRTQPVGPSTATVVLSLSEALLTAPILTFNPDPAGPDQQAIPLALESGGPSLWRATLIVTSDMPSGEARFAFQGADLVGNTGTGITTGGTLSLDTRGPVGTITLSKASPLGPGNLVFSLGLDEPAALTPSLSFTPEGGSQVPVPLAEAAGSTDKRHWTGEASIGPATGDGEASLSYSAQDGLGNIGGTLSGGTTSFLIDTVSPGAPVAVRANPGPGGIVSLSWSGPAGERPFEYRVYRDSAAIAQVEPAADRTGTYVDTPAEGHHVYHVSSVDMAGNESELSDPGATADATRPNSPTGLSAQLNAFGGITLTWQSGDPETVAYRLYGSLSPIMTLEGVPRRAAVPPYTDTPGRDGTYHYRVTALDAVGNESDPSGEVSLFYDKAAPLISVQGVTAGLYAAGNVTVSFSAEDANLAGVQAALDGQSFASGGVVSQEGGHTLAVSAQDTEGHSAETSLSFTVDKTSPAVQFANLQNGATLYSPIAIAVLITELNPGASSFVLTNLDSGSSEPYAPGTPITADGRYVLSAQAHDLAGNEGNGSISFRLDLAPGAPKELKAELGEGGAQLSWVQPEPDVVAYRVYKDGRRLSFGSLQALSYNDAGFSLGTRTVYEVTALDARGVEGPSAKVTVPAVAVAVPTVSLTRGFFDGVAVEVRNNGSAGIEAGPAVVSLMAGDVEVASGTASAAVIGAGGRGVLQAVLASPSALPANPVLKVRLGFATDPGAEVVVVRSYAAQVVDPQEPIVESLPDALVPGAVSPVGVRFYNRGSAPLDIVTAEVRDSTYAAVNDVLARLKTPEGTLFGQAGLKEPASQSTVVNGRQVFFVTVAPKSSVLLGPVRVLVPNTASGELLVEAVVSTPSYGLGTLNPLSGSRGFASSLKQAVVAAVPYTATAAAERGTYDQGSTVTIRGSAYDQSGATLAYVSVAVHVVKDGYDRVVGAVTDGEGAYAAGFTPMPGEAGLYGVFAAHPDVVSRAVQSSFSIVGMELGYRNYTLTMAQNSTLSFPVTLKNTGESALEGLSWSAQSLTGQGVTLTLDPASLPARLEPGQSAALELTASAAMTASPATLDFTLTESHGYSRTMAVAAQVSPAMVIPAADPASFRVGVLGGEVRTVPVTLTNKGFEPWRAVELTDPALPWVTLQGQKALGDIPPGGNANFTLRIAPPADLANQTYSPEPLIQATSLNSPPLRILGAIAVTSSRKAELLFSVIDADKPRSPSGMGVGIPGAGVTLISLDLEGLSFKQTADANGLARFTDVPSGRYAWRAEAKGWQTMSGTAVLEPGLVNQIEAVLPTATVSYEWSVTPTSILDKYNITLKLTFRTDVPAPAIIVDPPLADLKMTAGQTVYTQFTVKNVGLVSAFDVTLGPANADAALRLELGQGKIAELKAQQSVTVPVKVTLVHASCHGDKVQVKGKYTCAAGLTADTGEAAYSVTAGDCPSTGGGPTVTGAGGGGGSFNVVGGGEYLPVSPSAGSGSVASCGQGSGGGSSWGVNGGCEGVDAATGNNGTSGGTQGQTGGSPAMYFTPKYNSLRPKYSPLGYGWSADFMQYLKLNDDGSLTLTLPDGTELNFFQIGQLTQLLNGNGESYAQPVGVYTRMMVGKVTADGKPELISQVDKDGTKTDFQLYGGGALLPVRLTDRNGNTITYQRDPTGKLLRVTDIHGRTLDFGYDADGRLNTVTDTAGRVTSYGYDDAKDELISETDPNGDTTRYAYDANHRLTEVTYPAYGKRYFTYDAQGRVLEEKDALDGTGKNAYEYLSDRTVVTDALNRRTTLEWIEKSGLKKVSRVTDPRNGVTSFEYDTNMNLTRQTDPLGRLTKFEYDDKGNVTATVDPIGQTTQLAYEPNYNQPTAVTDPKGNRTQLYYDAKGNLIQAQDALNNMTQLAYDGQGHVTAAKDPLGQVSGFAYNQNGALTTVTDPLGRTAVMTRDALSRVTRFTDPAGKPTDFVYDAVGLVTRVRDALNYETNTVYRAGRGGRVPWTVTDANNHATTLGYDVLGRLETVTNALNQTAHIDYDAKSNPSVITTRNGQPIRLEYDELDRVKKMTGPEGDITMTYDGAGNLLTAHSYNGSGVALAHDALDRVTEVVQTLPNGYSVAIGYAFDANGNRTRMTTPWGGFDYTYDMLDRVTGITNPFGQVVTFAYDPLSRRTRMSYPNGTQSSYAYDAAGRIGQVLHQRNSNQTAIAFTNYDYDQAGNRTGITDANGSHTFSYDQLDRLTAASHSGSSTLPVKEEDFDYDPIGNRGNDAARTGYEYDAANRLVADASYTYTSDAEGNITSRTDRVTGETLTFIYDSGKHLTEVRNAAGVIAAYKYNPEGLRVEKNVGGVIRRYIYEKSRILAILDGNNGLIALFTTGPGIDSPLIVRRGGQDYFYHADALGNVTALTDASGSTVETVEYQAFGRAVIRDAQGGLHDQSTVGNELLYASREWDPETGLYYLRARHYDPDTGRFLQEDPVGSINEYAYADNSPILYTDPLGLQPTENWVYNTIGGFGYGASLGLLDASQGGFYDACSTSFRFAAGLGNLVGTTAFFGGVGKLVGMARAMWAARVARAARVAQGSKAPISWITPGGLPAAEEEAVVSALRHIDAGTKPVGKLARKWGTNFQNRFGDLPGTPGSGGYLEYRVAPTEGTVGAGLQRIVVSKTDGRVYYTWTHYGETKLNPLDPAFVRIR